MDGRILTELCRQHQDLQDLAVELRNKVRAGCNMNTHDLSVKFKNL